MRNIHLVINGARSPTRDITHLFYVICIVLIFLAIAAAKWYDVEQAEMLRETEYRIELMEGGR